MFVCTAAEKNFVSSCLCLPYAFVIIIILSQLWVIINPISQIYWSSSFWTSPGKQPFAFTSGSVVEFIVHLTKTYYHLGYLSESQLRFNPKWGMCYSWYSLSNCVCSPINVLISDEIRRQTCPAWAPAWNDRRRGEEDCERTAQDKVPKVLCYNWVIFFFFFKTFFFKFYFLMLFTMNVIFCYEADPVHWIFYKHCGYWWPAPIAFQWFRCSTDRTQLLSHLLYCCCMLRPKPLT